MPIHVGNGWVDSRNVKRIRRSSDTLSLKSGEVVEAWGHTCDWDPECVQPSELERWRLEGDSLCDAALKDVFPSASSSVGVDLLESLKAIASAEPGGSADIFLQDAMQRPPDSICVHERDFQIGTEFFFEHGVQVLQALLHFSLAGGFASPGITRTLRKVSYLVPRGSTAKITETSNTRTFSRLLETFQFVLDIMGCAPRRTATDVSPPPASSSSCLEPGGSGWASTIRVRMLHGVARRRIREQAERDGLTPWPSDEVPVNQEDLAATLASFAIAPLWCIRRLGIIIDPRRSAAYIAIWRHVGFYMGIRTDILMDYFREQDRGEKFLFFTVVHLFSPEAEDGIHDESMLAHYAPTVPILRAVSDRPPLRTSFEHNCALTRFFLGNALADHLGVPRTSVKAWVKLHAALAVQLVPVYFGNYWPRKGWRTKRIVVMKEGMERTVRWQLGMRRATFRPRTDEASREGVEEGELAEGVKEQEAVVPDPQGANVLGRLWREVIVEMVIVCVAGAVGVTAAGYWTSMTLLG